MGAVRSDGRRRGAVAVRATHAVARRNAVVSVSAADPLRLQPRLLKSAADAGALDDTAAGARWLAPQAPVIEGAKSSYSKNTILLLILILKIHFLASESFSEPSYDLLKLLSVYRSYPIDIPISSARLPTAGLGSTGAGALIPVRSTPMVPYEAAFSI